MFLLIVVNILLEIETNGVQIPFSGFGKFKTGLLHATYFVRVVFFCCRFKNAAPGI